MHHHHTADANILIIDDSRQHLQVLGTMLQNQGYTVRLALDGLQGMAAAQNDPPDVLLLDITMPDLDGYEVCRRLKADEHTRAIPIIFISARDATTDKVRAFKVGGVDYITKPFHAQEVLARVAAHLALRVLPRQLEQQNQQLQQEIAERQRAEAALRESEALLKAFLDYSPSLVFARDVQGRFVLANHAYEAMINYPAAQLVGKTPHDVLPHAVAHRFLQHDEEIISTGGPTTREEVVQLTGEVRTYLASKFPLYNEQGELTAIGGISTDITERKQAEEKIKQQNDELAAMNLMTEAVNRSLLVPDILATMQQLLEHSLHIAAGAVYLYHEEQHELSREVVWGTSPLMGDGFARLAVATAHNRTVVLEQRWLSGMTHAAGIAVDVEQPGHTGEQSYLGVPIVAQGRLQGVLDLFINPPATFSQEQITLFTTIGRQVGSAIENARLFAEVQHARERLQTLSRRLVEVQEMERHTIARELHDEVGQILTGLSLSLEMIARLPAEQVHTRLDDVVTLVNDLMQHVREMSMQLRPPMLDDLGLLPALLWHIERYTSQTGIQVIFKHTGIERRFAPEIETTVYRVIQEALTNVARYAGVSEVVVRLWARPDALGLQVEDQGIGFDAQQALHRYATSGLSGMQERMRLLGGTLQIDSAPGRGSCIIVELPLTDNDTEQYRAATA